MGVKKQKRHRRAVRFYTACFGFREPFKILCDGTFVHHLVANRITPADTALANILGATVKLFTTRFISTTPFLFSALFFTWSNFDCNNLEGKLNIFCFEIVWWLPVLFACRCVLAELKSLVLAKLKSLGGSYQESLNAANNLPIARLAFYSLKSRMSAASVLGTFFWVLPHNMNLTLLQMWPWDAEKCCRLHNWSYWGEQFWTLFCCYSRCWFAEKSSKGIWTYFPWFIMSYIVISVTWFSKTCEMGKSHILGCLVRKIFGSYLSISKMLNLQSLPFVCSQKIFNYLSGK